MRIAPDSSRFPDGAGRLNGDSFEWMEHNAETCLHSERDNRYFLRSLPPLLSHNYLLQIE